MKTLTVALLQLLPEEKIEANKEKGIEACKKAKLMGADIALFPEMWSVGFKIPKDINELKKMQLTLMATSSVRSEALQKN